MTLAALSRSRPDRFSRTMRTCGAILLAAAVCCAGCEPALRPRGSDTTPAIEFNQSMPEEAARTLMRVLREQQRLIAAGDRRAANALREKALEQLLARDEIRELGLISAAGARHGDKEELLQAAMRRTLDGWGALLGYYLDRLPLEMASMDGPVQGNWARIRIPTGVPETAPIRVICARGADARWRVASVEFVHRGRSTAATPATNSALGPGLLPSSSAPTTAPATP